LKKGFCPDSKSLLSYSRESRREMEPLLKNPFPPTLSNKEVQNESRREGETAVMIGSQRRASSFLKTISPFPYQIKRCKTKVEERVKPL